MPKITFKKVFFRIFWKILCKKRVRKAFIYAGSQRQGVEMKVAPFRALTLFLVHRFSILFYVEMEVAPSGH